MGWTTLRAWVTRLVAVAVLVSGIGLVDIAVTPPSADAAATWSPEACSPNSSRVSTDASAGGSAYECIANYRAHSNRGRLQHLIDPVRSSNPDEVYDFSEGIAEYVAQGRLISKLSGGSQTAVSPNFQWETTMPADARRLDVMTYSPGSSTGAVQVVELKGEWLATAAAAATQAQGYVTAITAGSSHSAALWLVQDGGYTDSFYRGKRCDAGDPGKVDGWRYTVSAPQAGVVYITRTPSQCTGTQKLTATQRAKVVKAETAMELAEDGDDIPAETMPTGTDANENGVPDYLDVAAYAGAGNVTTTHATTPYVEWETAVNEVTHYLDLVHLNDLLRKLTRQYGEAATRKVLDVIVRAMFSTANHLDQTVIERAVVRELSGIVIERELASVVGKAAASTMRTGIIDASTRIIERNGVKFLERTLGEAAARTLADLLVKYAARLGMTAPIGVIPVVGEVVLFILDVYFTVELILDLADLLGFNIWGDPHLVTMDRRIYDLQSAGEFVLSRVTGTGSVAQGRFVPSGSTISLQRRVALGDGADRFELTDTGALLDGEAMTLDGFTVTGSGMVLAHVGPTWLVTTKDGLSLLGSSVSNVRVVAGDGTSTSGLLGNNDGDPANDLALADGTVLTAPSLSTLHGPYADSWRITQAGSLFTYPSGESTTTYADRSFPQNVVTLGDFSPAQIDAANASCISSGVASGAMMDACVLDLLVTSDGSFAAAAAATRSVVDYAAATFDAAGVLRQGFDAGIPMAMQFPTIVQVSDSSRAVGPLFDASPYGMALLSVPRHDGATVRARVIVLGSAAAQDRQVSIVADGVASGAFSLEGAGGVLSGPSGSSIVADGTGVTPVGTAYRAYLLSVPVTHFGDALKLQFAPKNFFAILGSGLAVDSLELSLTVSPADSVSGLTVPFTAAAALGAGLGSLETPGAGDEYHFALTAAKDVLLETSLAPGVRAEIRRDSDGSLVSPTDSTNHLLFRELPPGTYRLTVASKSGAVASYSLPVLSPVPQSFSYVAGKSVSDGLVGGVAKPGAGNLETTASRDVYPFALTTARTVVFDSEQYNWILYYGSSLVRLSDGTILGPINGHREYALAAGSYQVVIDAPGRSGAYAFASLIKPSAQTFSYAVGKSVADGLVGGVAKAGAGNLETTASKDVYSFSLTAARTVVFDSEQYNWPLYYGSSLVRLSDGVSLGGINGHREYALAAGSYQVVVDAPAHPGTYAFTSFVKPAAQSFSYAVGKSVADGLVGGVAKPGAGNLETTASKDVYSFSLTAARTVVFDSEQYNWPLYYGSSLVRLSDGVSLGGINGHREYALAAGSYQVVVDAPAHPGTYAFTSFVKPAAQSFSYAVGQSVADGLVGGVAKPGAGNLETTASKDVYSFSLTAARTVVFDSEQYNWPLYYGSSLVRLSDGVSLGGINGHREYALAAGSYQVVVDAPAHPGTYAFTSFVKPAAQSFSYAVGKSVADGLVGGVAKPGAGNLETTASKDVYSFSLTAARTVVFDSEQYNWPLYYGSSLVRLSDGVSLGGINGHREYALAAGSYQVVVDAPAHPGTYAFTSFVKPAAQSFSYAVGQSVADGLVGGVAKAGAGNLETTASKDVYSFSLTAAQTVVFDSEQYNWPLYYGSSLVRLSDGVSLGPINGHRVFDLAAGSYQVVVDAPAHPGTYAFTSAAQ